MEASPQPSFEFRVPDELQAGRYANMLGVWHTAHDFTLDFSVTVPITTPGTMPCEVVARVKIAPSLIFDVLRALNENMTRYEETFGEIHRPGQEGGNGLDG